MNVLSLFDGISGARQALHDLGIEDINYWASEIDADAMQISAQNWPNIMQLGDVNDIQFYHPPYVDLLIGGSPCTDLSIAKRNREGLAGSESSLFFKYVDILKTVNPKYFLLENVASMSAANRDAISEILGVEPVLINSKYFTAQLRSRYYWTNIPVDLEFNHTAPKLQDILVDGWTEREKSYCVTATYSRACTQDYFNHAQRQMVWRIIPPTVVYADKGQDDFYQTAKPYMRKLLPIECERLQGLPCREVRVDIKWSSDEAKTFVNAVELNLKKLKFVGNVEKSKLNEFVKLVEMNIQLNSQLTKSIVQQNVDTQIPQQIKQLNLQTLSVYHLYAENAGKNVQLRLPELEENFALTNASINGIEEQITLTGVEELHLNDRQYMRHLNGNNALNISGVEMGQVVNYVAKNSTTMTMNSSTSIILNHFSMNSIVQMLTILYSYAKLVIDGYIAMQMLNSNLLIYMTSEYTECDGVPNGQRYKAIGNGFTVPVISWILKDLRNEYA